MANCIGLFVLVTLKRSRLDYLSAAECSVVWRAFLLAAVRDFRFALLNPILLSSLMSFRFQFLRNGIVEMSSTMLNLFLTSGSIAEVCFSYLEVSCYK